MSENAGLHWVLFLITTEMLENPHKKRNLFIVQHMTVRHVRSETVHFTCDLFSRILWTNYKIAKVPSDMILEQLSKAVVHNENNIIISSESYSYSVRERNIYTAQKEMCFRAPHHVINAHWQRHIEDSCEEENGFDFSSSRFEWNSC